jgi:hypothetical protein
LCFTEGIRRQDVADLAMGALTKGLAPISIFSNLLNAYATLDNKHDITGKYFTSLNFKLYLVHEICLFYLRKAHTVFVKKIHLGLFFTLFTTFFSSY